MTACPVNPDGYHEGPVERDEPRCGWSAVCTACGRRGLVFPTDEMLARAEGGRSEHVLNQLAAPSGAARWTGSSH